MEHIAWTRDLAIGVEHFDNQHKRFFKAANELAEAMWLGGGKDRVAKTLDLFNEYAQVHFRDEEDWMLQHGYPGYPAQKAAHEAFIREIANLKRRSDEGEPPTEIAIEILINACNWLRNHIRTLDKPLGVYLQNRLSGS